MSAFTFPIHVIPVPEVSCTVPLGRHLLQVLEVWRSTDNCLLNMWGYQSSKRSSCGAASIPDLLDAAKYLDLVLARYDNCPAKFQAMPNSYK